MTDIDRDVCVIGSGFGGGVATLRFTQAGASVVVLEKGSRWDGRSGSREFQQTQGDFGYWLEILNAYGGIDFKQNSVSVVATGRGLGGGSLVYSMVSLRAPTFAFDHRWPDGITRAALDPYYRRAEDQLAIAQLEWSGGPSDAWKTVSKRDGAFAWACRKAGVSCDPVPLAIGEACGNLGWCMAGCVRHAKNSVDFRYIQPAEDAGALVKVGATVTEIAPNGSHSAGRRRWKVTYTQPGEIFSKSVLADSVVVSAGAIGSPALLLGSARNLPGGISNQTGRNLSRGGDMMLFGVLPDDIGDLEPLETYKGKIIGTCSFHYMFNPPPGFGDDWRRFALQPMGGLPILPAALLADPDGMVECRGVLGGKQTWDMRTFGAGPKHYMRRFGDRLLQVGVMGIDDMDGQVTLTGSVPWVSFNTTEGTRQMWAAAKAGFKHVIEDGAGGKMLAGWDDVRNDSYTIHPLGTSRMADSARHGVVRHDCALWKGDGSGVHEGLYVMDAGTISTPIGVNTSLTTAAIAERACAQILGS